MWKLLEKMTRSERVAWLMGLTFLVVVVIAALMYAIVFKVAFGAEMSEHAANVALAVWIPGLIITAAYETVRSALR